MKTPIETPVELPDEIEHFLRRIEELAAGYEALIKLRDTAGMFADAISELEEKMSEDAITGADDATTRADEETSAIVKFTVLREDKPHLAH